MKATIAFAMAILSDECHRVCRMVAHLIPHSGIEPPLQMFKRRSSVQTRGPPDGKTSNKVAADETVPKVAVREVGAPRDRAMQAAIR